MPTTETNKNPDTASKRLIIKHAGSLGGVFNQINEEFKRLHNDVEIISGGGGSASLVRDVVNGAECSILASADYSLIPRLMFPEHADWYIMFASSQMVLRYTDQSRYHDEINEKNWFEILQRKGVTFWHSDPNEDPGGYRALMVLQLAEKYYNIPGLYGKLMVPEHNRIVTRTTFQESALGYSFGYGLRGGPGVSKTISLPDEINLSRKDLAGYYSQATVRITGNNPGESFMLKGEPILFGVTIPRTCPDEQIALEWIYLLLGTTGKTLMEKAGMVPLQPAIASDTRVIPQVLKSRLE